MKRDRALRPRLLNRAFNGNLVGNPSRVYQVSLNERDAMFQREVVNLLAINDGDHDLVVANDALSSSRSKRQSVRAWTVHRLVVHRHDAEITLFIAMPNVVVARRCSEEEAFANANVLIFEAVCE